MEIELGQDSINMRLGCAPRDEQPRRDLAVAQTPGDKRGDINLAPREGRAGFGVIAYPTSWRSSFDPFESECHGRIEVHRSPFPLSIYGRHPAYGVARCRQPALDPNAQIPTPGEAKLLARSGGGCLEGNSSCGLCQSRGESCKSLQHRHDCGGAPQLLHSVHGFDEMDFGSAELPLIKAEISEIG